MNSEWRSGGNGLECFWLEWNKIDVFKRFQIFSLLFACLVTVSNISNNLVFANSHILVFFSSTAIISDTVEIHFLDVYCTFIAIESNEVISLRFQRFDRLLFITFTNKMNFHFFAIFLVALFSVAVGAPKKQHNCKFQIFNIFSLYNCKIYLLFVDCFH